MLAIKLIQSLTKSFLIASSLIVISLIILVGFTHKGLESLIDYVGQSTGWVIVLQDFQGTLASGLYAQSLSIEREETLTIDATKLALRINLQSLLLGRLDIKSLSADTLSIKSKPTDTHELDRESSQDMGTVASTSLPELAIEDINIKATTLYTPQIGSSVELQYLRGTWNTVNQKRNIHLFTQIAYQHQESSLSVHTEGSAQSWAQKANLHLGNYILSVRGKTYQDLTQLTCAIQKEQEPSLPIAQVEIKHKDNIIKLHSDFSSDAISFNTTHLTGSIDGLFSPETIQFQSKNIKGKINNKDFFAKGYMILGTSTQDSVAELDLHYGDQYIQSHLNLPAQIASWDIKLDNLNAFSHQISGSLTSQGNMVSNSSKASLALKNLVIKGNHLDSVNVELSGNPTAHEIHIKAQRLNGIVQATSSGIYTNHTLTQTIKTLELTKNNDQLATLNQPAILTYSKSGLTLSPLCVSSSKFGSLCLELIDDETQTTTTIEAQDINLGAWSNLLLRQLHLKGQSTFKATAQHKGSKTDLDINLNATNLQLFNHLNQPLHDLIQSVQLNTNLHDAEKKLDINSQFAHDKPLLIHLESQQSSEDESNKLLGHIQWQTSQLQWLDLFGIESSKGLLDANINLSGTVDHPSMQGVISVDHGQIYLPFLNLLLNNINTQVNLSKNQLNLVGSTESGGGLLEIDAQGTWLNKVLLVDGKIKGSDVLVVNSPDLMIYASPRLQWTLKNTQMDIQGTADIPTAEIKFQNFDNIATLPDETIKMNEKKSQTPTFGLSYHLDLQCGKKVLVNTYGIKGGVSGNLLLHKYFADEPLVDGQLKLRSNSFYQNDLGITLSIESGTLNYTNQPFDEPSLYVKAIKAIEPSSTESSPSKVGINIEGPISELRSTYFAEPAGSASSQEILSYIILGKSSSQELSDDKKNALIFNAIQTLGDNKTGSLHNTMNNIKKSLSLNDLALELDTSNPFNSIESETQESFTSIKLGKQFSDKIYVQSNIGAPMGLMSLRYIFSKHWSLEASGSYGWQGQTHPLSAGADVYYSF